MAGLLMLGRQENGSIGSVSLIESDISVILRQEDVCWVALLTPTHLRGATAQLRFWINTSCHCRIAGLRTIGSNSLNK